MSGPANKWVAISGRLRGKAEELMGSLLRDRSLQLHGILRLGQAWAARSPVDIAPRPGRYG